MNEQTTQFTPGEGVIHFGIGQPGMSILPVDLLQQAAEHRLALRNPDVLNYGPHAGDDHFRQRLATFLSEHYEMAVNGTDLFTTAGASQGLNFMCQHYTQRGDVILVESPSYFLAFQIFVDHGLRVVSVPCDGEGMLMDALETAVLEHRPTAVYTIPAYHNPLGVTLSAERRARLVQLSQEHGFTIIADEVYQLLNYTGDMPRPLRYYAEQIGNDRVFSLGSFSKIFAPGLRLGWIHTTPEQVDFMENRGYVISGGSLNHVASTIMQSGFELGLQESYLAFLKQTYQHRIDLMDRCLRACLPDGIVWEKPLGGFFFWLSFPDGVDTAVLVEKAADYGVAFHAGHKFGQAADLRNKLR
ncbi:MAG: PLP-dependent aminotransferase family protein, partial [Sphaerospermopsis sp. SIO1G2]|nr:PLP-dependent aminotransferase family protein [Sphaerospermopsis sp. SIO1G2]